MPLHNSNEFSFWFCMFVSIGAGIISNLAKQWYLTGYNVFLKYMCVFQIFHDLATLKPLLSQADRILNSVFFEWYCCIYFGLCQ